MAILTNSKKTTIYNNKESIMAKQQQYTADSVKSLGMLEAIRVRPGMYIGDKNVHGLHHLLFEPTDNAIDEVQGGFASKVIVTLHGDGSASVEDDGRGIPIDFKPGSGMSALTEVLTRTHSGAKFTKEGEEAAYSTSGGLHGVGIKATNAFSAWLVVEVRRHGVRFRQRFENGGEPATAVEILDAAGQKVGEVSAETTLVIEKKTGLLTGLKVNGQAAPAQAKADLGTGTKLHFRPHRPWFDAGLDWPQPDKSVPWDFERIETRLEQLAHLYPGVRLELYDERGPRKDHKKRVFKSEKGLLDYIAARNKGLEALHKPIQFSGQNEDGTVKVEVVLQYAGDEPGGDITSFVNGIPTPQGGTAVSGFQAGLTKAVNQFGQDKKLLKDGTTRGEDLLLGLTAVINVTLSGRIEPQFASQTKQQLTTPEAQGVATSVVYENLLAYLNKNIPVGRVIVNQAVAAQRGREAAKAARQLVVRKSILEVEGLPGKLADVSRDADSAKTVLFIVEGDSAGGGAKQARNRNYHAILPLRGKILNTEKVEMKKILANAEIKSMVAAIGAGIGADFNVTTMRYGGVSIMTDADVDGAHICTLLITFFYRHMTELVKQGRLYIAYAPLYLIKTNKKGNFYAYDDEERDRILAHLGQSNVTNVQRYKGLGEMNPEQLRETILAVNENDEQPALNEHLYQVVVEDTHLANMMLVKLMGKDVKARQEWLLEMWAGEDAAAWETNGDAVTDEDND